MAKVLGYSVAYINRDGDIAIIDDFGNEIVVSVKLDKTVPNPSVIQDGFTEWEKPRFVKIVECDENGEEV